jgi:hypothetical protein
VSLSVSAWLVVVSALPAASKAEADGHQTMFFALLTVEVDPVVLPRVTVIAEPLCDIVDSVVEPTAQMSRWKTRSRWSPCRCSPG